MKILNTTIDVSQLLKKNSKVALLLDYDGTLAPFKVDRMQAHPYPGIKERLLGIIQSNKTRVIIISGRNLADLEQILNIPHLELWGSHGLERKLTNGKKVNVEVDDKLKEGLKKGITVCQAHVNNEHCEIKPYAVAVHWRGLTQTEQSTIATSVRPLWENICRDYNLEIHLFDGGLELRPKEGNKGDVILKLIKELPNNTSIIYMGDDLTDEEAFSSLGNLGLKVLVREELRPTLADIWISPQELPAFLDQLNLCN